jgi:hypothetical protein
MCTPGADGAFYGNPLLLGKHIAAICMVCPYFFVMSLIRKFAPTALPYTAHAAR